MKTVLTFISISVLLSLSSCKKEFKEAAIDYPVTELTKFINDSIQKVVINGFKPDDDGMMALAVYLTDEDEILLDKKYYLSSNGTAFPADSTLFQLASVTKVFTAAMVTKQVNLGKLDFNAPVQAYLPPDLPKLPNSFEGTPVSISMNYLCSMRSGLVRNSLVNYKDKPPSTPYLYGFGYLDTLTLRYLPGSNCNLYSNLGFAVAGLVLSHQVFPNNPSYFDQFETVMIDSLLRPMGLKNTRITLDSIQKKRRAIPYLPKGGVTGYENKNWPMNLAAGGLYSNLPDMKIFAKNMIGEGSYLNQRDLDTLLATRGYVRGRKEPCKLNADSLRQAMGWVSKEDIKVGDKSHWRYFKDGGLNGTSTFVTFSTVKENGKIYKGYVVMLVNRGGFPVQPNSKNVLQEIFSLIPSE